MYNKNVIEKEFNCRMASERKLFNKIISNIDIILSETGGKCRLDNRIIPLVEILHSPKIYKVLTDSLIAANLVAENGAADRMTENIFHIDFSMPRLYFEYTDEEYEALIDAADDDFSWDWMDPRNSKIEINFNYNQAKSGFYGGDCPGSLIITYFSHKGDPNKVYPKLESRPNIDPTLVEAHRIICKFWYPDDIRLLMQVMKISLL